MRADSSVGSRRTPRLDMTRLTCMHHRAGIDRRQCYRRESDCRRTSRNRCAARRIRAGPGHGHCLYAAMSWGVLTRRQASSSGPRGDATGERTAVRLREPCTRTARVRSVRVFRNRRCYRVRHAHDRIGRELDSEIAPDRIGTPGSSPSGSGAATGRSIDHANAQHIPGIACKARFELIAMLMGHVGPLPD